MIAHLSTTTSFERTARYLAVGNSAPTPDRVLWVEPYGGASPDLLTAASEMEELSRYSGNVEVPGYHLILSFDPEDEVGKQEMLYVRDQIHDALGFPDLMSTVVAHGDAYYPHWHELICRVDYWTGRVVDPSFPYHTIEQRLREVERELGLRETPGRHGRLPDQTFQRKFDWTWLSTEDKQCVRAALREATSWRDLEERLAKRNLGLRLDRSNLTIVRGPHQIRAGTLHRGSSLRKMEERMGQTFADYAQSLRREAPEPLQTRRRDPAERPVADPGRASGPIPPLRSPPQRKGAAPRTDGTFHRGVGERGVGEGGTADTKEPVGKGRGTAPPGVRTVLDSLQRLAQIEAENRAAAQAVEGVRRRQLWQSHLYDLAARTVDARRTLEALLTRVYRDPKRASARYQILSAAYGQATAAQKLRAQPGWFGVPTPLGRSAEGELILQEAAARGADYVDLLRSAQEIQSRLVADGLIERPNHEMQPVAVPGGETPEPDMVKRIADRLGNERAKEVLRADQKDTHGRLYWESPELPTILARTLSHPVSMPDRDRISKLRRSAQKLTVTIRRRIESLGTAQRTHLRAAVQRDPRLRESTQVARLLRPGRSRARSGITR